MKERLIIADDITGASGIGTLFNANGFHTEVYFQWAKEYNLEADVLIIDTDSRFYNSKEAYRSVFELTSKMKKIGIEYFYHKTCTVFRGNVASELDAILDVTGEKNAYLVAGFPDNLRTVVDSIAFVDGIPAAESHYSKDPMNPILSSNLVESFQKESKRRAVGFNLKDLRKSFEERKEILKKLESNYEVIIFDIETNEDLEKITELIKNKKVIGGSSALGRTLGQETSKNNLPNKEKLKENSLGILGISASITPKTKKQIEYLKNTDIELLSISPFEIYHKPEKLKSIIDFVIGKIAQGESMMIHTENSEFEVQRVNQLFHELDYSKQKQSFIITNLLAEIAYAVKKDLGLNRFFIAGGDTSASFCKKFKIDGFKILEEIDIGLSSVISLTDTKNLMILKSGNFGQEGFIKEAFDYLKNY